MADKVARNSKEKAEKNFKGIIAEMKDLPSLPTTVTEILEVLNNPESSAMDLSAALKHDQSLVSRVLRLVNSAFYGFPRTIDNLSKAVTILGYTAIQNIILTTSIFETLNQSNDNLALNRKEFWRHALATGVAAQIIKTKTKPGKGDEVFLAGLLHDIGKVVLDAHLHKKYSDVYAYSKKKNILIRDAEKKLLGVTHDHFGSWLAESWNLPHNLTAAITYHHNPQNAEKHIILASLVHLGDILARSFEVGNGGDDLIPQVNHRAWDVLRLNPSHLKDLAVEFDLKFTQAQIFIEDAN